MYVLFKEILHITNGTNMYVCTLQGKRVKRKPPVGSAGSYIRPSTGASGRDAQGARILTNTNTPPQRQGQIQEAYKTVAHFGKLLSFDCLSNPYLVGRGELGREGRGASLEGAGEHRRRELEESPTAHSTAHTQSHQ